MPLPFKPYIEQIPTYEPGKPVEEVKRELGLKNVIKVASNENPLGISPKVLRAVKKSLAKAYLYPDMSGFCLKERLAEKLGVDRSEIVLGNGSDDILELIARGFISPGDKAISSKTSYLLYPIVTKSQGGEYIEIPQRDFKYDLNAIRDNIDKKTNVVFISNPNNPTGTYVNRKELTDFLDAVPDRVLVVIDEAYCDFAEANDYPDGVFFVKVGRPNVIVCRTFSKSSGLAGLRVGYGVANAQLVGYLDKFRQPFNVNRLAQEAAVAALGDEEFLSRTKEVVSDGKEYLYRQLDRLPVRYVPSEANFILIDLGTDSGEAFDFFVRKGVVVRDMSSYGLCTFIRVTVGLPRQNRIFIKILKKFLKEKKL